MNGHLFPGCIVESPVALVVAETETLRSAAAIHTFSEVAHHPTTLWVSLPVASGVRSLIEESGRFTLAVLQKKQAEIARHCLRASAPGCDNCGTLPLYRTRDGYLFLRGAQACVACRVRSRHPVGDHIIFIADLLFGDVDRGARPLRHLLVSDV